MQITTFVLCLAASLAVADAARGKRSASVNRQQAAAATLAAVKSHQHKEASSAHGAEEGPVSKVVTLLRELREKLVTDGQAEQKAYDVFACWCEETTGEKAGDITDEERMMREDGQEMLTGKGKVASLSSEIKGLKSDLLENKESRDEATALRLKENAEFNLNAEEWKKVLTALEKAMAVLREGTKPSSFLQEGTSATLAVKAVIEALPATTALKPEQLALLSEFTTSASGEGYAPQSGTVQGILSNMYLTFARKLEEAYETEATRNRDYEALMSTGEKQYLQMDGDKSDAEADKAHENSDLADNSQSYDDTDEQKGADTKFFGFTKELCRSKHLDYEARVALRTEEIAGVEKAIELLTSDSARELFNSAIKPGKEIGAFFLQVSSDQAELPLEDAARQVGSLRLASLVVKLKNKKAGHFDEVLADIDKMITTLKEEHTADIAKRDQCKEEYLKVKSTLAEVQWKISKNEAAIDKVNRRLETLEGEKEQAISEIQQIQKEMKAMEEQRKEENDAFLNAQKDDKAAIELLGQAKDALTSYYTNHSIEMGVIQGDVKGLELAQQEPEKPWKPELEFSDKGARKQMSKGIVSMMTMIIEDLHDEIAADKKSEILAQTSYEEQLAASQKMEEGLTEKLANLKTMITKRKKVLADEKVDKLNNENELEDEKEYQATIKTDCDWIFENFPKRSAKRAVELQGLTKAKEYLASYQPPALIEKQKGFNDHVLENIDFQMS